MTDQPRFLVARPNLSVTDIEASLAFDRDVLGFQATAVMGEPPNFALLHRDGAELALVQQDGATPSGCYIYVTGVEQVHEQCVAGGAKVTYPLTMEPWGLLNFVVEDPDGHRIAIGERTSSS